jgi:8-oxo-dGTP pyrophosphatase MutT (NUDIX family)
VLVRPAEDDGFEILLTRRPREMKFLGGYYVFPGGTVHAGDHSSQVLERCLGLSGKQARSILGGEHPDHVALGHWVAVFRELFEEVGVLLCTTEDGLHVHIGEERKNEFERQRQAIVNDRLDFGSFLESEDLYCDLSRVVYFDHWVTPEIYSMRFDTRFYLARLPNNQHPLGRSEEVTDSLWIKPAEALTRNDLRDLPLIPPTTTVLRDLAKVNSFGRLCEQYFPN